MIDRISYNLNDHEVGRDIQFYPCPYVCTSIRTSITLYSIILNSETPPVLFDAGTCNTVRRYTEHVHKGNKILIRSLLQNHFPLNENIFWLYHTVVLFVSPQLLLQNFMQRFKTCYTVQTSILHVHVNRFLIKHLLILDMTIAWTSFRLRWW